MEERKGNATSPSGNIPPCAATSRFNPQSFILDANQMPAQLQDVSPVPIFLENHASVCSAFGHWISFHDGKLLSLTEGTDQSLELLIHGWIMTDAVDEKGFFVLKDHHLVAFRFEGISNLSREGFCQPNILFSLDFQRGPDESFEVVLQSVMSPDASFTAKKGRVVSVVPCDPQGCPI